MGHPPQLRGRRSRAQSDAQVEADARRALGIGDVPVPIRKITRWLVDAVLASLFCRGGAFLVGDAAHRHPDRRAGLDQRDPRRAEPVWKIAAVLTDGASPALLDTYEAERRPVDERNCQRSLENALNHFAIATALGVAPENSAEQNTALLRRIWSGWPEDAELRSSALRAMRAQSMEFSELNVEYGYTYESAATVPRGSRPTTSGSTSRRRVRAPLCRTARDCGSNGVTA